MPTDESIMPTQPLPPGAVTVLEPGTGELLGYAFSWESGAGQAQRWILHRHPHNELTVAKPPETMARWTKQDWRSAVPELWRPGSYYVRAQADLYAFGGSYGDRTWKVLPEDHELPAPTYPPDDSPAQFDPTRTSIELWSLDQTRLGVIFVEGKLDADSNAEYWLLLPGFSLDLGAQSVTARAGTSSVPDLRGFVQMANALWAPGAVLAITGCRNFHDVTGTGKLPPVL